MPYTQNHVLVRAIGHMGPTSAIGAERWSVGWRIANTGAAASAAELQTFANSVRTAFVTYWGGTDPSKGSNAWFDYITTAEIGTNGLYTGGGAQQTTISSSVTPVQGSTTTIHPWSSALVLTTRGAIRRGRASHGRFYMPATGQALGNDGVLSAASQAGAADLAKTLLDQINTAAVGLWGAGSRVAIMSNLGAGTTNKVLEVSCGRRLDAQERRENTMAESYVSRTLA